MAKLTAKEVKISLPESLLPAFNAQWFSEQTREVLGATFQSEIEVTAARPQFLTEAQRQYLESIGAPLKQPSGYRMRIGPEVKETTEHPGGVELSDTVLGTPETFRREVLNRLRNAIGAPEDN